MKDWLKTYKIILILFVYLGLASLLYYLITKTSPMTFLMGLFFITFSFFKVIHLPEFQKSFKRYDLIAKAIPFYGWAYPFIEIILGILFLTNFYIFGASVVTVIILLATNVGVISVLRKGQIIECACLGVVFNLPLSTITIFENTVMIIMSLSQIYFLY